VWQDAAREIDTTVFAWTPAGDGPAPRPGLSGGDRMRKEARWCLAVGTVLWLASTPARLGAG